MDDDRETELPRDRGRVVVARVVDDDDLVDDVVRQIFVGPAKGSHRVVRGHDHDQSLSVDHVYGSRGRTCEVGEYTTHDTEVTEKILSATSVSMPIGRPSPTLYSS